MSSKFVATDLHIALRNTGATKQTATNVASAMMERVGSQVTYLTNPTEANNEEYTAWRNVKRLAVAAFLLNGHGVADAVSRGTALRNWARDEGVKPDVTEANLTTSDISKVLVAAGISDEKRQAINLILGGGQ